MQTTDVNLLYDLPSVSIPQQAAEESHAGNIQLPFLLSTKQAGVVVTATMSGQSPVKPIYHFRGQQVAQPAQLNVPVRSFTGAPPPAAGRPNQAAVAGAWGPPQVPHQPAPAPEPEMVTLVYQVPGFGEIPTQYLAVLYDATFMTLVSDAGNLASRVPNDPNGTIVILEQGYAKVYPTGVEFVYDGRKFSVLTYELLA